MNEIKRVLRQRYVVRGRKVGLEVERQHTIEFFRWEDSKNLSSDQTFQAGEYFMLELGDMTGNG